MPDRGIVEVELHARNRNAFVVVVGTLDATRASALAEVVDELACQKSFRRVSVDLTCAVPSDREAAATLQALAAGAAPSIDVATPGAIGRLLRARHTSKTRDRVSPSPRTANAGGHA